MYANLLNRILGIVTRDCQESHESGSRGRSPSMVSMFVIRSGAFPRAVLDIAVGIGIILSTLVPCLSARALPGYGAEAFSAGLMLGECVRPVGFTPLLISLRTPGPFKGMIHVSMKDDSTVMCRIPVNVGKGDFRFAIAAPINTHKSSFLIVRLLDQHGRISANRELELMAFNVNTPNLTSSQLGVMIVENPPQPMFSGRPNGGREFAPIWVENLPEDPLLFDAVDFVMAPAGVCSRMNAAQAKALAQWVHAGGTLIVDSSARDQEVDRNPLLERLGIELEPIRQTTIVSVPPPVLTNARYGRQPPMPQPVQGEATTNERMISVAVNLRPIRCGEAYASGTNALRTDVVMGCGRLILTSVDMAALLQNDGYGENALLYEILSGQAMADRDPELAKNPAFRRYYSYSKQPSWTDALFEMAGLEGISFLFVIGFLIVFVLVVSPLTRWGLGRMGLLRWTWLVKAVIVLVFCFVGGGVAYLTRGTEPLRSMLCVHQYGATGGGRHVWLDCFIPSRSRSVNASPLPGGMVCDLSAFAPGSRAICDGARRDVEFNSPVWGAHFLYSTVLHDEPAPFKVALSNVAGSSVWFVTCLRPDMDVRNVSIVWREKEFQTMPVNGGWLAIGSNCVSLVQAVDDRSNLLDARGRLMLSLAQMDSRPSLAGTAAGTFVPAPIHGWLRSGDWGVILAECGHGPESRMEIKTPRKTALHVLRQVVRRPANTVPGAAPDASEEIYSSEELRMRKQESPHD